MNKNQPNDITIKIDEEIAGLFGDLTGWEYESLKADIKKHGIQIPLTFSKDGILVCGHQRYKIAKELRIAKKKIPYIIIDFKDRQEMIDYAINDNILRRNLNLYQKALLGLKILPYEKKKAKERQLAGLKQNRKDGITDIQNLGGRGSTYRLVAERIGISHESLRKVQKIQEFATDQQKEYLLKGELSVNSVYRDIKDQEREALKLKKYSYRVSAEVAFDTPDYKTFQMIAERFGIRNILNNKEAEAEKSILIFDKFNRIAIKSNNDNAKKILVPFADNKINKNKNIEEYKLDDITWDKIPGEMIENSLIIEDLVYVTNLLKKFGEDKINFKTKNKSPIEVSSENFTFTIAPIIKKEAVANDEA